MKRLTHELAVWLYGELLEPQIVSDFSRGSCTFYSNILYGFAVLLGKVDKNTVIFAKKIF
jgi:hypothetical protein